MNTVRSQQGGRDAQRTQASREELVERIASAHPSDGEIRLSV